MALGGKWVESPKGNLARGKRLAAAAADGDVDVPDGTARRRREGEIQKGLE